MKIFFMFQAFLLISLVSLHLIPAQHAKPCDETKCKLPDCRCSTTDIPGGLDRNQVPQIVTVTFNEAFNFRTDETLPTIFDKKFHSPNGCPFRATHFVSHYSSDYSLINKWWIQGHEIATMSISKDRNQTYWAQINETGWHLEIDGLRKIIKDYAKIPITELKGMRAPMLQNGGDIQFKMMSDVKINYDATMPSEAFGFINIGKGLWPYSLDYASTQDCSILPCVNSSFPGVWEIPILALESDKGDPCDTLGDCLAGVADSDPELIYLLLARNFKRAYSGNRPVFGLHMQVADLLRAQYIMDGVLMFFEYLTTLPDVYVVTMSEALEYTRNPVPLAEIDSFKPFQCDHIPRPRTCLNIKNCRFLPSQLPPELASSGEIYMKICGNTCPKEYPWLNQ